MVTGAAIAAVIATGGAVPASNLVPGVEDFRLQEIRRAASEGEWPFQAESGTLACAEVLGEPQVYFIPAGRDDRDRGFAISVDLMSMSIINLGMSDVLAPYDTFEQLLARLVPFVTMGQRLCDQEPGSVVPASEL